MVRSPPTSRIAVILAPRDEAAILLGHWFSQVKASTSAPASESQPARPSHGAISSFPGSAWERTAIRGSASRASQKRRRSKVSTQSVSDSGFTG
jgi:hypothetical protein